MPSDKTSTLSGITFEQAMTALEKIVNEMENAELPLERLLEQYEEGMKMARLCDEKLSEAEKKVEFLTTPAPTHNPEQEVAPLAPRVTEVSLF
jgi:exodeoxyribonuclease VII small subunit